MLLFKSRQSATDPCCYEWPFHRHNFSPSFSLEITSSQHGKCREETKEPKFPGFFLLGSKPVCLLLPCAMKYWLQFQDNEAKNILLRELLLRIFFRIDPFWGIKIGICLDKCFRCLKEKSWQKHLKIFLKRNTWTILSLEISIFIKNWTIRKGLRTFLWL